MSACTIGDWRLYHQASLKRGDHGVAVRVVVGVARALGRYVS